MWQVRAWSFAILGNVAPNFPPNVGVRPNGDLERPGVKRPSKAISLAPNNVENVTKRGVGKKAVLLTPPP